MMIMTFQDNKRSDSNESKWIRQAIPNIFTKRVFSDKPLFNVPALTEEEQANMQEIKDNINPNVKIVIEESVQDATKSFAKLDSAVKTYMK